MARKGKPRLEHVRMERIAAEGRCLAHVEQGTLFVGQTAPGELVEVQVTKVRS